jgi:GT2 family glycosyltransferase
MPQLSICITTRNRKSLLTETLDHIFYKQNLPGSDYEVIVVNDGEENLDDLLMHFENMPLLIVHNNGSGVAKGRNTGARQARSQVILFYDDDILPSPDHFIRHLALHQLHQDWIVTANRFYSEGLLKLAGKTPFGRYKLQYEYDWKVGIANKSPVENNPGLYYSDLLAGFSVSMRKTTFDTLGGFSENFEYASCEDSEFFYRAAQLGFRLLFDEANICQHNEIDNFVLERWLNRQSTGIKGGLVMVSLHPEGRFHPTFYLNAPVHWRDSYHLKLQKLRRYALSNILARKIFRAAIFVSEKTHAPDALLFRLYSAAWIGETHHSFLQTYRKMFGKAQFE